MVSEIKTLIFPDKIPCNIEQSVTFCSELHINQVISFINMDQMLSPYSTKNVND